MRPHSEPGIRRDAKGGSKHTSPRQREVALQTVPARHGRSCWASNSRGASATCGWLSEEGDVDVGVEFAERPWSARRARRLPRGTTDSPQEWAASGHDAVPDADVGGSAAVRCAENGIQQVRLWAEAQWHFTAVRGDGDRLAEAGELRGGGPKVPVDLGRGGEDPGTGGSAGAVSARGAPVVGVDETSFQRRHESVTAVDDLTTSEPRVLHVADGRSCAALDGYPQRAGHRRLRADPNGGDGHVAGLHRVGARTHEALIRGHQHRKWVTGQAMAGSLIPLSLYLSMVYGVLVVDRMGFEPTTSALRTRRSPD